MFGESIGKRIIVWISIKYSMVEKSDWSSSKDFVTNLLEKYGFKVHLMIRPFGLDEIWAILSSVDVESIEKIEDEPFVLNVISLYRSLPLDKNRLKDVFAKKTPIAYLFFHKRRITLENISELVSNAGGIPLLTGVIDDPRGHSHFAQITLQHNSIAGLNEVVHQVIKEIGCRKWNCRLGAKHGWPRVETIEEKIEVTGEIGEILERYYFQGNTL